MTKIALVVDDTPFIREDIKDILEDQGYEVYEANDGLEAVEMYKKINPAIVTMDINMPRMHGLKATQVITDFDNGYVPKLYENGKRSWSKGILIKTFWWTGIYEWIFKIIFIVCFFVFINFLNIMIFYLF